jgi:hypothetical protein
MVVSCDGSFDDQKDSGSIMFLINGKMIIWIGTVKLIVRFDCSCVKYMIEYPSG